MRTTLKEMEKQHDYTRIMKNIRESFYIYGNYEQPINDMMLLYLQLSDTYKKKIKNFNFDNMTSPRIYDLADIYIYSDFMPAGTYYFSNFQYMNQYKNIEATSLYFCTFGIARKYNNGKVTHTTVFDMDVVVEEVRHPENSNDMCVDSTYDVYIPTKIYNDICKYFNPERNFIQYNRD